MQISLWEKESYYRPSDILIVGAGFAGLWTAFELKKKKPRLNITVIDRGIVPTGASTRNAGFSCFGSLTELLYDARTFGEEKMISLAQQRYDGLRYIQQHFKASEIDYEQSGGYELLAENGPYDVTYLKSDLKRLNRLLAKTFDEKDIFVKADKKVKKFGFSGVSHLVENRLEGCLHSGKLTQALTQQLMKSGVRFLFGLEAVSYQKSAAAITLSCSPAVELKTNHLVICTNAFTGQLVPGITVKPARGQVLVTSAIKGLPFTGSFHYDEGFVYFRNVGNRVLLGGARNKFFTEEETSDLGISDNIQNELERLLREMIIPGFRGYTIDHRWSGTMGMGPDKTPAVRHLQDNVFCAMALGGIGVAMAPVAAKEVTKMILGKNRK